MMIAILLPALLAGASLPPDYSAQIDAQVAEAFRPYKDDIDDQAVWDRPIFSAEVNALIAHWQKVLPDDEPDRLNDGDWLCQCQDWDAKAFKAEIASRAALSEGRASVDVKIDLFGDPNGIRDAKLIFTREGGAWKIDDIFAKDSFPDGLKQALRETIAEDEALRAGKRK